MTSSESPFFDSYRDGEITIVRLTQSHLTDEDNIEVFGNELTNLVEHYNYNKIVVDVVNVVYVTSSVLGKLITLHRRLGRLEDGRMIICNIGPELMEVLETSRLHSYFSIAEDVPSAIRQMQSGESGPASNSA